MSGDKIKVISWNVNGMRAILKKGMLDWLYKEKPNIFLIQEIKAREKDLSNLREKAPDYHMYFNSAEKKGYSGTAIFTKTEPSKITYGIGVKEHDNEGRVITLSYDKFYVVCVYVPNSGDGLRRLEYRQGWDKAFKNYLKKLDKKKPVIIGGDFNVAHEEIDLARPRQNYNKTAGYTQQEIDGFDNFEKAGFVDTYRHFYPKKQMFSFWSYRFNCRAKNIGWRIDYLLASKRFMKKIKSAKILTEIKGSDHCPIVVNLEL